MGAETLHHAPLFALNGVYGLDPILQFERCPSRQKQFSANTPLNLVRHSPSVSSEMTNKTIQLLKPSCPLTSPLPRFRHSSITYRPISLHQLQHPHSQTLPIRIPDLWPCLSEDKPATDRNPRFACLSLDHLIPFSTHAHVLPHCAPGMKRTKKCGCAKDVDDKVLDSADVAPSVLKRSYSHFRHLQSL